MPELELYLTQSFYVAELLLISSDDCSSQEDMSSELLYGQGEGTLLQNFNNHLSYRFTVGLETDGFKFRSGRDVCICDVRAYEIPRMTIDTANNVY